MRFDEPEFRPAVLPVAVSELLTSKRLWPTMNSIRPGWRADSKLAIMVLFAQGVVG